MDRRMSNSLEKNCGPCEICGREGDSCICPECPVCHDFGNEKCYVRPGRGVMGCHNMMLTKEQLISKQECQIKIAEENLSDERAYLVWLNEQPDDYKTQMGPAPPPPTKYLSLTMVLEMLEALQAAVRGRRVTDSTLRLGLRSLPGVDRYYDGKLEAYFQLENDIKKAVEQARKEAPQ